MAETVLVTGAAGYIGSILVPSLLREGYRVIALDTYARNDASLAALCADTHFEPVRGDARDEHLVKRLCAEADCIIPLAALVGAPLCQQDPTSATTTNRDAVLMLLSHLTKDQRVIYPTTNSG